MLFTFKDRVSKCINKYIDNNTCSIILGYIDDESFDMMHIHEYLMGGHDITLRIPYNTVNSFSKYRTDKLRRMFSEKLFPIFVEPTLYYACSRCKIMYNRHETTTTEFAYKRDCINCENYYFEDEWGKREVASLRKREYIKIYEPFKNLSGESLMWLYDQNIEIQKKKQDI